MEESKVDWPFRILVGVVLAMLISMLPVVLFMVQEQDRRTAVCLPDEIVSMAATQEGNTVLTCNKQSE